MIELLSGNIIFELIYFYFLILIPAPTTPLVVLFFATHNYIYSSLIYIIATLCCFFTLYSFPYFISKKQAILISKKILPKRLRNLSSTIFSDFANKSALGVISITSLTQIIPIFIIIPIFSYFKGKKRILIQYGLFNGIFNSLFYICIAAQGTKIYNIVINKKELSPQNLIEGAVLIFSLIWVIFIYRKNLKKIILKFSKKKSVL